MFTLKNKTREINVPPDAEFDGSCNKNESEITFRWSQEGNRTRSMKNELTLHLVASNDIFYVDKVGMKLILNEGDATIF